MRGCISCAVGDAGSCCGSKNVEGFVKGGGEGGTGELISVSGEPVQAHPW